MAGVLDGELKSDYIIDLDQKSILSTIPALRIRDHSRTIGDRRVLLLFFRFEVSGVGLVDPTDVFELEHSGVMTPLRDYIDRQFRSRSDYYGMAFLLPGL